MQEKSSRVGWVLGGIGAVLFGLLVVYLFNPRWFGERFIHFNGSIKRLEPLGADRFFVIEHVQTGGGEDGPTTVGDRWRILEAATGKLLVGPHYVDPVSWATVRDDRLVMKSRDDLEVRGFDNKLIANLDSWKGVSNLRRTSNDVTLGEDGQITAMADDGRFYLLDLKTLQASPAPARPRTKGHVSLSSASIKGFELVVSPRAQVNRAGPDYLEPTWVQDPVTGSAIRAGDGYLMLHYQRMHDSKDGRGPMLSAVNARGEETWRYVLPFQFLYNVAVFDTQLVIGLNEHAEYGPGWIRVLNLANGQESWKLAL